MAGTQSGSPDSGFTETGVTNPPQSGEHNTKKKCDIFLRRQSYAAKCTYGSIHVLSSVECAYGLVGGQSTKKVAHSSRTTLMKNASGHSILAHIFPACVNRQKRSVFKIYFRSTINCLFYKGHNKCIFS
jgi:hypothetical protein